MKKNLWLIIVAFCICNINLLAEAIPVTLRDPLQYLNNLSADMDDYYIGYGCSSINKPNYTQIAKQNALSELSSQINVSISGHIISQVIEKSSAVEEELTSSIAMITQSQLEGIEVHQVIETDEEYWVFYRLSKKVYRQKQEEKIKNAVERALSNYSLAKSYLAQDQTNSSISELINALFELEPVLNSDLSINIGQEQKYLDLAIYSELYNLLSEMNLSPEDTTRTFLHNNSDVIKLKLTYKDKPVDNIPVSFELLQGSSNISEQSKTNTNGEAIIQLIKPNCEVRNHYLKAKLNLAEYFAHKANTPVALLVNSLPVPEIMHSFEVRGNRFFLTNSDELSKDVLDLINPIIITHFTKRGHSFVQSEGIADYVISFEIKVTKGGEAFNMLTAFSDMSLMITKKATQQTVCSANVVGIKGVSSKYEQAVNKACEKATKKLLEIISADI